MVAPRELLVRFRSEARPGAWWSRTFERLWPWYERWWLSEGVAPRPSYLECEQALEKHLPELVPAWRAACEASGGGDLEARFLSGWRPPPVIVGCAQAAWGRDKPFLVRNYDFAPRLWEGIVLRTAWNGRGVIASTDGLIGALDGINEDGLCVSLNFGGRRAVGAGFGAPVVLRYLLETCRTVGEAATVLRRVPTHMAYNVLVMDRTGDFVTAFTAPGQPARLQRVPVTTNHQGRVTWAAHAEMSSTLERERVLVERIADAKLEPETFIGSFLEPPLRSTDYDGGFGTLYTAVYRPVEQVAEFLWPGVRVRRSIDDFVEETCAVLELGTAAGGI
jgi:predicted choloylglycine hydrolase